MRIMGLNNMGGLSPCLKRILKKKFNAFHAVHSLKKRSVCL